MHRTRRLVGLVAAAALAILVLPFTAMGDVATTDPDPFVVTESDGTLEIETGADYILVERFAQDGSLDWFDRLDLTKTDKCLILAVDDDSTTDDALDFTPPSTPSGELLSLGASDGSNPIDLGLVSNGIGSRENNNCNTNNGFIENGQELVITLGDGLRADSAVLDVEGKFGASLEVTRLLDGAPLEGDPIIEPLNSDNSDNGADAGPDDNEAVPISAAGAGDDFDTLVLTPDSPDDRGVFALEGGGDYDDPTSNRTVFNLVTVVGDFDYSLDCGEEVSVNFAELDAASLQQSAVLQRYDADAKDGSPCLPIGAELSPAVDGGISLENTMTDAAGGEQAPNLRLTLTWRVELENADGTLRPLTDIEDELAREINILDTGFRPVQFCTANNDVGDVLREASRPTITEGAEEDLNGNGTTGEDIDLPWCLLDESVTVVDGYLIQVHAYDGAIDPTWQ